VTFNRGARLDGALTSTRCVHRQIGDFALSVLPETGPDSTCLDVLNYFQQGRSHILLVSRVSLASLNTRCATCGSSYHKGTLA
jgi:hypothetical protein